MKRLLQVGLILMLAAAVFPSNAHAGFIFGAGVGSNTVEIDEDFDESDLGWKAFAGFRFVRFFGIEAQYVEFGNPETDDAEVELTDLAVYATGVIPIGKHFEVFGKAGYGQWDVQIEDTSLGDVVADESEWDFTYGAGAAILIGEHFGIRFEYEIFEVDDTDNVSMASAGIDFRF